MAASAALDDPDLTRICEQDSSFAGGPIPDFISSQHIVEVKELTSRSLRKFTAAYDALPGRHIPIPSFRRLWAVSVDVSAAAGTYDANPKTPQVNTLIVSLTTMIEDLESRGFTDSFADHDNFGKYAKSLGFYCHLAVQPDTSLAPGILFSGSISEQSRTTELDYDVTAFLQDWLDSGKATNAQESLAGRAGVHVLVLMASPDGPASGLIHTVQETPGEVPSAALRLPHDIDVLIVATNTDVLLFTPRDGWSRHTAPPLH
jgi:hypothetical protein